MDDISAAVSEGERQKCRVRDIEAYINLRTQPALETSVTGRWFLGPQ